MTRVAPTPSQREHATAARHSFGLEYAKPTLCPVAALRLDLENPRLQTGTDIEVRDEAELIEVLADIAALDELVLSICTNTYLNLEPLIVHGPASGPFTVLEGNRRLASIRLILNPALAREVGVQVPKPVSAKVIKSIEQVLVYRVKEPEDAREFIGFKHINGPQRWDAYAKARYVADWYKKENGKIGIDEIAAKMGDANNTLRAYIVAILALDQAREAGQWSLEDRPPTKGRFAFSHWYTALTRAEYQQVLGLTGSWSNNPPIKPIKRQYVEALGEVLGYIYGSVSEERPPLVRSQNPDLKDLGLAIADPNARKILKNRGSLEDAVDALKEPVSAFHDAILVVKLKLDRAIQLFPKYVAKDPVVDSLVNEVFTQADMLKTINDKNKSRAKG